MKKCLVSKEETNKAIENAIIAYNNAYTPLTNHNVGACVITKKGNFYKGCNVQSVISGLGTCAERASIDNAISDGQYTFKAIAIVSKIPVMPCGVCLQYLTEFSEVSGNDIIIISADTLGKIHKKTTLHKTVKHLYGPKASNKDISKYQDK